MLQNEIGQGHTSLWHRTNIRHGKNLWINAVPAVL